MNNGILFVLFVAEMSFQFLPKILHEIFGVALMIATIFHVAINRRRFVALTKKITPRKIFSVAINFALIICMAVIVVNGAFISNYLFADVVSFELRRNMTIHQLHVATPYLMMIFIGVHIGLHWQEIWQKYFKRFVPEKFFKAASIILSAIGVAGLFLNRVGDRILMKHIFGTPATELPGAFFALMIIGGVIFFALITFLLDKKFLTRS